MPEGTAACCVDWLKNCAVAKAPSLSCADNELDTLISKANAIGIDAPFGWPEAFVAAVTNWTDDAWTTEARDRFRFRETDRAVRDRIGRWPLSVSTDRIALPAMRAMALLHRHEVTNLSGDGRFFEVYPAGSLFCWELRCRGYKRIDEECLGFRNEILRQLRKKLPWLDVPETYAESSDTLDALVAALTVRVAVQGATIKPSSTQIASAQHEGWIHLPSDWPRL